MVAEQTGALLKYIEIDERGVLQWENAIGPKTKIVALAHVSNVTGTINPIAEIARSAHAVGAILVVDGAQGAPHMGVDVRKLGCDFYAFSGHKCYGPTGIGVLYGKRELLEAMPPVQGGGGDMIARVDLDRTTYAAPPLRFEAGTPLIGGVIALKSALDFIESIGRHAIAAHEEAPHAAGRKAACCDPRTPLSRHRARKRADPHISDRRGSILSISPRSSTSKTSRSGADTSAPNQPCAPSGSRQLHAPRFGVYNTIEEIDHFAEAVREAAATLLIP